METQLGTIDKKSIMNIYRAIMGILLLSGFATEMMKTGYEVLAEITNVRHAYNLHILC